MTASTGASIDQAAGLRNIQNPRPVKVIAVTGGKGGVGKTSISTNLAIALAKTNKNVVLFDADLGLANVDVMLGLHASKNLSQVISGECTLKDILIEGPQGIQIIPGASGTEKMVSLSKSEHAGLIKAFSSIANNTDVLIIDTAAGISDSVISFTQASHEIVIVVCDEPTSITDSYALMKILNRKHSIPRFRILANMVKDPDQGAHLYSKLRSVCEQYLEVTLDFVGSIPHDKMLSKAVQIQKPLVEAFPKSPAALAINKLSEVVDKWPLVNKSKGNIEFFLERLLNCKATHSSISNEVNS